MEPRLRPITVLVVDDDRDICSLTQLALEVSTDWRVITAAGGAEAVAVARTAHPDAVLMDVMMPGIDGITAIDKIRENASTAHIPIIIFSAKCSPPGRTPPWTGHEVAGVISKPYDPLVVADQVRAILGWH